MKSPPRILFSLLLLLLQSERLHAILPKNVVSEHIMNYTDFSVDPCDDFYAHACPATRTGNFFTDLRKIKEGILEDYLKSNPEWNLFKEEQTKKREATLRKMMEDVDFMNTICANDFRRFNSFGCYLTTIDWKGDLGCVEWMALPCPQKVEALMKKVSDASSNYLMSRFSLRVALNAHLTYQQIKEPLEQRARHFFNSLRRAVGNAIDKTPWLIKKNVVEQYKRALNNITFTTFADLESTTGPIFKLYPKKLVRCMQELVGRYPSDRMTVFCDVVVTGSSLVLLENTTIANVYETDKAAILKDSAALFNAEDDHVYMGNDIMLLLNSDLVSDIAGTVGLSLTHEIMHSFVFDHLDRQRPLAPFWTKNAGCVEEQAKKTCQTFPTVICDDTKRTFEEDAADLTAYRIVWDIYEKIHRKTRKTNVKNYNALNNNQLFFYGAAVFFCQEGGMENKAPNNNIHSNNYQRVNSLMSQMDPFARAFNCKPTDKMIRNKAKHCDLYGRGAPSTRKSANSSG